jgi:hypothetical protein
VNLLGEIFFEGGKKSGGISGCYLVGWSLHEIVFGPGEVLHYYIGVEMCVTSNMTNSSNGVTCNSDYDNLVCYLYFP